MSRILKSVLVLTVLGNEAAGCAFLAGYGTDDERQESAGSLVLAD